MYNITQLHTHSKHRESESLATCGGLVKMPLLPRPCIGPRGPSIILQTRVKDLGSNSRGSPTINWSFGEAMSRAGKLAPEVNRWVLLLQAQQHRSACKSC